MNTQTYVSHLGLAATPLPWERWDHATREALGPLLRALLEQARDRLEAAASLEEVHRLGGEIAAYRRLLGRLDSHDPGGGSGSPGTSLYG